MCACVCVQLKKYFTYHRVPSLRRPSIHTNTKSNLPEWGWIFCFARRIPLIPYRCASVCFVCCRPKPRVCFVRVTEKCQSGLISDRTGRYPCGAGVLQVNARWSSGSHRTSYFAAYRTRCPRCAEGSIEGLGRIKYAIVWYERLEVDFKLKC